MNNFDAWWATYNAALTGYLARDSDAGVDGLSEKLIHGICGDHADAAHGPLDKTECVEMTTPHGKVRIAGSAAALVFITYATQYGARDACALEESQKRTADEQKAQREKLT